MMMRILGQRQPPKGPPPRGLLAPETTGQPAPSPSTAQIVSGGNRKRWIDYAEAEASAGRDALPYAEWLKRQK